MWHGRRQSRRRFTRCIPAFRHRSIRYLTLAAMVVVVVVVVVVAAAVVARGSAKDCRQPRDTTVCRAMAQARTAMHGRS